MAWWRKRRADEPVDEDYRSPKLGLRAGDLKVLAALAQNGADLTHPRHVLHYLYLPDQASGETAAASLRQSGWEVEVREPIPGTTDWSVVAQRDGVVTDPATVRDTSDLMEQTAAAHGGSYDGWEASV